MIRHRRLFLASLLAVWVSVVMGSGCVPTSPQPDEKLIPFEVLKEWRRGDGKVFLYVLVSEKASKADVMKLAEHLWQRDDIATLNVFDARAAFESEQWQEQNLRDNPAYPQKELSRHWLAQGLEKSEGGKVEWIAQGREEQGADSKTAAKPIPKVETEAEQREREVRDRQRREELRKSKPELDAKQAKEEAAYRAVKEEARLRTAKVQVDYRASGQGGVRRGAQSASCP
jgi:hypothetical protein